MSRKRRKKKSRQGSATGPPPQMPPFVQLVVETPVAKLDLHGLTANQAARRLRDFVRTQSRLSSGKVVHIVTGRGTHSSGPAVLPGLTQAMLAEELDEFVLETAGLPGGGAVAVRLS